MLHALFAILASILGPAVVKALKFIGFSVVTYAGIDVVISNVQNQIATSFGGLTSDALTMVSLMGIDSAITILLSAYATAFTFKKAAGFFGL